jgi:hypothetical protein
MKLLQCDDTFIVFAHIGGKSAGHRRSSATNIFISDFFRRRVAIHYTGTAPQPLC